MNEKDLMHIKESLTMPSEIADTLLQCRAQPRRKHYRYSRYSKICAALAAIFCIGAIGSTSLAAYNIYQEKQLAVFMDYDLTQEEIANLGKQLSQISEIASYHYISGDEAWEEFKARYLDDTPELADSFDHNPLADSFNYRVSIRMGADTQAVRDQIGRIEGVRLITTIRELENSGDTIE